MQVKEILIPNKPHLDPIAAIYLLLEYGKDKFPGVEKAKVSFWEHSHDPSPEETQTLEENGTLLIDLGGGIFDHHGKNDQNETAFSLVAQHLGIESNPELATLLNYIQEDDLAGLHNRYGELAYLVKCMHKQKTELSAVIQFTLQALHFFQLTQKDWHHKTRLEFEEKCQVISVKRNRKKIKFGVIESDNLQISNYGISVAGLSLVIQRRSTGHTIILTNKHHRVDLREIVAAIRLRELEFLGMKKPGDPRKMQFEGKSAQLPFWFYHRSLNAMMNGSDAITKAPATKIPLNEIINLVHYGLSSEPSEYCDCQTGGGKCPFAPYGFSKCQRQNPSQ